MTPSAPLAAGRRRLLVALATSLVCAFAGFTAAAQTDAPASYRGMARVTGVADGDTVYVEIDGRSIRLRLAQIDAPEKKQAFGRRSEQSLRELVGKRDVLVAWRSLDRYGRPIAQVTVDALDVNAEQVRRGMAWVFVRYSNDAELLEFERQARAARLGLWSDVHPMPPWEWRAEHRSAAEAR